MDYIVSELGIPRKQICETTTQNRFKCIAHKSYLKNLTKSKKISNFAVYPNIIDEWPKQCNLLSSWMQIYIVAYKKLSQKVIPLPKQKSEQTENELPMTYSQLLHYIQQTNYKNLWKSAYKKYGNSNEETTSDIKVSTTTSAKMPESVNSSLIAYEVLMRETIVRLYNCPVIHYKLDKYTSDSTSDDSASSTLQDEIINVNHFPFLAAIESNTHFYLLHCPVVDNTLLDCITYSPAILEKTYDKALFVIYQLFNFLKSIHEKGLLMGDVKLSDIYLTENLLIQVIPKIDSNLIEYEEPSDAVDEPGEAHSCYQHSPMLKTPIYTLKDYCEMWCTGKITNFDYLTMLNNFAGRRIDSADYHHIVPWVIDFSTKNGNWRDLTRTKYRLTKGDAQLDITYQHIKLGSAEITTPHHVSDVLSEITFYVYMARKTPKSVLCRHVRPKFVAAEYPASIKRLQEWTPDECIPEFFNDASVFKSIHEDLSDLKIPTWSTCPEDFIAKHREALESQYVSENLHHWIDLTFGYKLSGKAAVKAKNVVLSLVDEHRTLCQRGVVQLFTSHHPPKQFKNPWFSKVPPRINSSELRKRLTRSTEDLSMENYVANEILSSTPPSTSTRSPRSSSRTPHRNESIERSPSYHIGPRVAQSAQLPPSYNPIHQLKAVENMGNFLAKTFHETSSSKLQQSSFEYPLSQSFQSYLVEKEAENSFTNKIFLETYERSLKDTKMYQNIKQRKQQLLNSKKQFKQIMQEQKTKDLRILGCLIVEIFMNKKLRSLTSSNSSFEERYNACLKLMKHDEKLLPGCVKYAVELLFGMHSDESQITNLGLPDPTVQQFLQPILYNFLIPFPVHYFRIYAAIKSLKSFESSLQMLDLYMFYDCDGKNCEKYEEQDKSRVQIQRRIAECQVKAFITLTEGLLEPSGFEQFDAVELLLPFIIDMFNSEETGILTAWFLFDPISTAIGIEKSKKYLLPALLRLYDVHNDEKVNFLNTNLESSFKLTASTFRSKKAVKLYHHSFLIKLIIRLGLRCFLDNFTSILIEAAGGTKDAEIESPYHLHDSIQNIDLMATKDISLNEKSIDESPTLVSPTHSADIDDDDDKTMSAKVVMDEMFEFDNDEAQQAETDIAIARLIENFEIHSETSSIDMKLNHSEAEEIDEQLNESQSDAVSPTIPIPAIFKRGIPVASIGCEIGSRKSTDSLDMLSKTPLERDDSTKSSSSRSESIRARSQSRTPASTARPSKSTRISEMAAESLLWLAHRLGPVLTARYITRNLLKMLTICYLSQENLLPSLSKEPSENLAVFSIADGYVVGDENAQKVLDCLTSISALFGEHFILHQYLPHVSELVSLSKKKITASLEGGLISCVQLMKFIIPCLSDATIMEQLQEVFLKNIIKPIIRLLNSTHYVMPSGFLGRSVLARKLVDLLYILTIRCGTEIACEQLCDPHLQRFFLIFDKAYGIENPDDDANNEDIRDKGLDEIRETFTPALAHAAYLPFAKQLGERTMRRTVKNLELILNLSHEHEAPQAHEKDSTKAQTPSRFALDHVGSPSSFGTNVAIVGNRLDFQTTADCGPMSEQTNLIDLVAYKLKNVNSNRQLKGNWLAYWTNEIGRAEKDQNFNLKQIRLQTFAGHTNSIRGILCLDNENSFMSASKDRTVKLWSLRNEGDGSKISTCQFTYTGHKKSVHSLAFLESMRLTVSCDGGIHLWDPFVGSLVSQLDGPRYTPVSIVRSYPTPSSLIFAGTADTTVKAIDSRMCEYVLEWKLTTAPAGSVRCLTVSPSARWIALGLPGGQITLIDGRTGFIVASWKATDGELLQMQAPNDNELIVSSLDNTLSVWNVNSATRLYDLKTPAEPVHCLRLNNDELIVGTPANRIGAYSLLQHDQPQSYTKLRTEVFGKGVLTTFSLLPLNRLLLAGNDGGNITLLC